MTKWSDSGSELWKQAKFVIPGGNMLLSKRPEMFLPGLWPTYFRKAKGCEVWDLDDRRYVDMSIMGVGTNVLGYGDAFVDDAVKKTIELGNMSTLNCPEEVRLAERLIQIHPWSDMIRFARTGGEANAIAVRIARASSGRDKVAICGYHGWHDWYLSVNLDNENGLDDHHLPGLSTFGVPPVLKETVFPFRYNEFDQLDKLVKDHNIGVIKMEVERNSPPKDKFLEKVRALATSKGIVLVFDECTSGFRSTFGGLHGHYAVEPDIVVFGKALGNGYAISAILGRREIMEACQTTFISSTFWGERIGPTAAIATLQEMEEQKSWEKVIATDKLIRKGWADLAALYNQDITISGITGIPSFTFQGANHLVYKTLITQEMLRNNILASNAVFVCTKHTKVVLEDYFQKLEDVFRLISGQNNATDIHKLLEGHVCESTFTRLN